MKFSNPPKKTPKQKFNHYKRTYLQHAVLASVEKNVYCPEE